MALQNAFGEVSLEETQQLIAYALMAILEKMPRVSSTDQAVVSLDGTNGQYLNLHVNSVGSSLDGKTFPLTQMPFALADAGVARVYQQLSFTGV